MGEARCRFLTAGRDEGAPLSKLVRPLRDASQKGSAEDTQDVDEEFRRGEGQEGSKGREEEVDEQMDDGLSQGVAAVDEGEGEEGRAPVQAKTPQRVSQREMEEHRLTHTPFRSWCRWCVMARARNAQHRSKAADGDEGCKVPRISMDYFFMSEIDRRASENPMLVMVNEATGGKMLGLLDVKVWVSQEVWIG